MSRTTLPILAAMLLSAACGGGEPATNERAAAPPATRTAGTASAEPAEAPEEERRACAPAPGTLCPADEASLDPSFAEYRERLLDAVRQKDEAKLLPLLDEKIRIGFGGGGGVADFRQKWGTGSPDSKLWPELLEVLLLGGSFRGEGDDRMFWAPYVYSRWPEEFDAFEHVAVTRASAPLHERAGEQAPEVARLDWAVVRLIDSPNAATEAWRQVRAQDGTTGWVRGEDLRSPIEYRAGFRKIDGEWKMSIFVAGD